MKINIDKKIDNNKCPGGMFCTVATTHYDSFERERICLQCWLAFCKENNIEILYGDEVLES